MIRKFALTAACLSVLAIGAVAGNVDSGLAIGDNVTPFHPQHVTGPNKGTDACPPCTYGNLPQVQVWVNTDSNANVAAIAKTLNEAVLANSKSELKGFVIYAIPESKSGETAKFLGAFAERLGTNDIALAWIPTTDEAVEAYKINLAPEVKNTVIVYRNMKVTSKFVNLKADEKGLAELNEAIAKTTKA